MNQRKNTSIKLISILAISFVVFAWWVTFISFDISYFDINLKPNEFGDMFGGLNALFTGLAFAGIIITILLQREDLKAQKKILDLQYEELKLQRLELKETRKVLTNQQIEMTEQNETLKLQQFENTLFSMINVFNEIISTIRHSNNYEGKQAIQSLYVHNHGNLKQDPAIKVDGWFQENDISFGPYFRMLYNIIRFIDKSGMGNKKFYVQIVRDQLSISETFFLCLFGMRTDNNKEFKVFIEKYCLLRMLEADFQVNTQISDFYNDTAFHNG